MSLKELDTERVKPRVKVLAKRARKPIYLPPPLILDGEIAKLIGMMPDGSLRKNLTGVSFGQKKDPNKVNEFEKILINRLGVPKEYIRIREQEGGTKVVNINNSTLAVLFYKCLDVAKSDEEEKIPFWIKDSPKSVVETYISEIFAMEGTVEDPSTGRKEVRFHTTDRSFALEVKKLLKKRFEIGSTIRKYFAPKYGFKYYIEIKGEENLKKFAKIGVSLKTHQRRLKEVIKSYKPRAWETTLIAILKHPKKKFKNSDLRKKLNLHRGAIYWRLKQLIEKKYVKHLNKKVYTLTEEGKRKAEELWDKGVRVVSLETDPRENEKKVTRSLKEGNKYINQLARELGIHRETISDVISRLVQKGKAKLVKEDRFQRKYYGLKKRND